MPQIKITIASKNGGVSSTKQGSYKVAQANQAQSAKMSANNTPAQIKIMKTLDSLKAIATPSKLDPNAMKQTKEQQMLLL